MPEDIFVLYETEEKIKSLLDKGLWSEDITEKQSTLWTLVYALGFKSSDFSKSPKGR